MKKRTMFLLSLLVILIAAGGLLGCRPSPLDEEGDFTLGARLLAFADKSYVGWEEVSGAAGYKLYRNVGLDNYDDFAEEGVDGSKLISNNDQGEEDVAFADEYAEDYLNEDTDEVEFPEFIYYKVFAYDADDAVIAESNIATVFSHLPPVENISYKTDVEEIEISWDKLTDDTYTILGYQVYRYDSSKDSHARNVPLGKVEQGANPTFTVTDAKRTEEWNYYIAPYDEIGVSATSSGGRVYADLPGPLVSQEQNGSEIDVTWPAVKGEINDTPVTGYNVYLAYKSGGMSSSYLKYETTGYDEGETGDALDALNGDTPVTETSFTYDYDAPGVDPYDSLAGGESYDYYFIVQAVSSAGESANYSKYEFNDPVIITR